MKVITNVKALGLGDYDYETPFAEFLKTADRDTVLLDVFSSIKEQFDDQADNSSAYLHDQDATDLQDEVIFGAEHPEEILKIAKGWNQDINKQVLDAIKEALPPLERGEMDSQHTYRLSCTARMADDHWFCFSDYATYLESKECNYPYFQVLLKGAEIEDITANPENYIIITVYPK